MTEFVTAGAIAGCGAYDAKCICENNDFISEISCCLIDSCNDPEEQERTIRFAHEICASVDVTGLPDEVVCKESAASSASATDASASDTAAAATSESPSNTADAGESEESESPNAGPAATMAPVGILGGLIAAVAML